MAGSIAEFFLENFRAHGRECAYRQRHGYRMEEFSYGRVVELALAFARELDGRRIAKGHRVLLWADNCAEWVAAFFGCALRGVVVVPMDDGAAPDFVGRVCQQVDAKLALVSRSNGESLNGISIPTYFLEGLSAAPREGSDISP